jgi:2-aminoethylphosphonate-pyruvate transaminase
MMEHVSPLSSPILLTPGPVQLEPSILQSILENGHLHHRMSSFTTLFQNCHSKMREIFDIPDCYEIVFMGCSGTGMTEAMFRNYKAIQKGSVLCLVNGHFGLRLTRMAETLGLSCITMHAEEGRNFSIADIQHIIDENPHIAAIAAVHMETSLGQLNELQVIAEFCREKSLKFLVDMVSSFGGEDFEIASLAPSIAVTVSGKAIGSMPGLGCALIHKDVIKQLFEQRTTEHYFSFLPYIESRVKRNEMPFTPPVHLFAALNQALNLIEKETLAGKIARHRQGLQILQGIAESFGFKKFPCESPSSTTQTFVYPVSDAERFDHFHKSLLDQHFLPLQNQQTQRERGHFQLSTMGHIHPHVLERLAFNLGQSAHPTHEMPSLENER